VKSRTVIKTGEIKSGEAVKLSGVIASPPLYIEEANKINLGGLDLKFKAKKETLNLCTLKKARFVLILQVIFFIFFVIIRFYNALKACGNLSYVIF
jgi:hypothetical protein